MKGLIATYFEENSNFKQEIVAIREQRKLQEIELTVSALAEENLLLPDIIDIVAQYSVTKPQITSSLDKEDRKGESYNQSILSRYSKPSRLTPQQTIQERNQSSFISWRGMVKRCFSSDRQSLPSEENERDIEVGELPPSQSTSENSSSTSWTNRIKNYFSYSYWRG
jgi:hypothetical protein